MYQKLVSLNDDLRRMAEKGYAIGFDSGYLVIRDIPYLDHAGDPQVGSFVTKLVFVDQYRVQQEDHQVFFAGGVPYQQDGSPIGNLGGGPTSLSLSERYKDVIVERSFSNKPKVDGNLVGFKDFFAKVESYTAVISGPAIERFGKSPYTFRIDPHEAPHPVFKFTDSLTARAEIVDIADKLTNDVIAIIGLGGTGSYLLDFMVKAPVHGIRGFDFDPFHVHNAYRSPGRLQADEFGQSKAEVYTERYENFRHGLSLKTTRIDATSLDELDGVTFAFVCVDKGSSRAGIFEALIAKKIPFIDVGMGLKRRDGGLTGQARLTYYPPEQAERLRDLHLAELHDSPDDLYRTNIQIGELNALNAALAVIRYKQLRNFYHSDENILHLLFRISDMHLIGETQFNENPT